MPGHGSKKQSQRTKGNLRPSSSSHAAELLQAAGTAPTGFIGFGQSPMYVPASSTLEDMDASLDSEIRMVLRKLTKRDATTKVKGLQEFTEICKDKSEEVLKAALPFWPRTYNKIALDVDHRVREACQNAMAALAVRVKRNLAPYLRSLMGAWLLSQCDTYPTVASSAQQAFQTAFPPAKQTEALGYCKLNILEFLTENLVSHTQQSLSDPKTTDPEDMENKYNRVLTSSLLAIRKLLISLPANQSESLTQPFTSLLDNPKFWKHSKSKVSMVRGAMMSCLAGLCQSLPELCAPYVNKMAPLIFYNLDEKDPAICAYLWEAALSLVNFSENCWEHVNAQKGFWPKLKIVLESGCHGNAVVIGPNLLPLLSRIPSDMFADHSKFYNDFFDCFRTGLGSAALQKSPSECGAAVKAYMECAQYVIRHTQSTPIAANILMDQVYPVIAASLLEADFSLYQTTLYGMMGNMLTGLELGENSAGKQTASQFWLQLKENVELNLSSDEESTTSNSFEERLVILVKYLFYPNSPVAKQKKTGKVKFKLSTDIDKISDDPENIKDIQTKLEKISLGENGKSFVQDVTLMTFELAHKHFSTTHLRVFSQLLELDSSAETIGRVIECCHGEVATETTSHYFVFEICIPWLSKLQQQSGACDVGEAYKHLIHTVCLFIPVLDTESVSTLLEKLCKSCMDSAAEYILFEKLFSLSTVSAPVRTWIQGGQFCERLAIRTRSLSQVLDLDLLAEEIDHNLSILSLVLTTKTESGEPVVQESCIESLLKAVLQTLATIKGCASSDHADKLSSFTAQAALDVFTKYKASLMMDAGLELLIKLFDMALCNPHNVTGETLVCLRDACVAGVVDVVKQTGGLLYDTGLLGKISARVQGAVEPSVNSIEKLTVAMDTITSLLSAVLSGLPEADQNNPVYLGFIKSLLVPVNTKVPHQVWSYLCVKGDYPCIPPVSKDCEFPRNTLFTSLYNCSLLGHFYSKKENSCGENEIVNKSEHGQDDKMLETLLDCIQGSEIVQLFIQQHKQILNIPSIMEAVNQLSVCIQTVTQNCLNSHNRHTLWSKSYKRSEGDGNFVLSQRKVLSLMISNTTEPLKLELAPILDRCSVLTEMSISSLHNMADHLSPTDRLTFMEILVARMLSLPQESVLQLDGGIGLLYSLASLVPLVAQSYESEAGELVPSALNQVMVWKEDNSDILLYASDISESSNSVVLFNCALARFIGATVHHLSHRLTQEQWDFIMCSLASWIQSVDESQADIERSTGVQCFVVSSCQLCVEVVTCITDKASASADLYPTNLVTEWTEFFSESVFTALLPLYLQMCIKAQNQAMLDTRALMLSAICEAVSLTPENLIQDHKLPPLLVAGDLSPLPDNLQTLLNHMCPLLLTNERAIQVSAYTILNRIIGSLPEYDKEDKSLVEGATGDTDQEETKRLFTAFGMNAREFYVLKKIKGELSPPLDLDNLVKVFDQPTKCPQSVISLQQVLLLHYNCTTFISINPTDKAFKSALYFISPPSGVMKVLDASTTVLEELLCNVPVDSCHPIDPLSTNYHTAVAYLQAWKMLLNFFESAPSELRQEYALHLRDHSYVERLMQHVFSLMPHNPTHMFQQEPNINIHESGTSSEVQHLACSLYTQILRTIPAMARNWWKDQDRKTAAYIDAFTSKHVSQCLCSAEIQGVQKQKLDDMTIKTRPATREVIAVYTLEEVTVEMVISLPPNYPLGNINVSSEKRVGVSKAQWEKWLLQLNIFLQHQNGNIVDGLRLWKKNIDKRFEGVDECMICFYVLHGTNFQLPKITCRTCKKKFHSACLYKWFNTSHNCTCPLCRNVF